MCLREKSRHKPVTVDVAPNPRRSPESGFGQQSFKVELLQWAVNDRILRCGEGFLEQEDKEIH